MIRRFAFLCVVLWITVPWLPVKAENYYYVTNAETTRFGERVCYWAGDTLWGDMRSNDAFCFSLSNCPTVYGQVISSAPGFWNQDSGYYDPDCFLGSPPHFNAPLLDWPENADTIREGAQWWGNFFDPPDNQYARVRIIDHAMLVSWGTIGEPVDTTNYDYHALNWDSMVVFFDCPVQLSGTVSDILIFGASGDIGLENDIKYECCSAPFCHDISSDCPDKLAIISEGSVYVMNTVANGRDNANGGGQGQNNPNYSSIVISAYIAALGGEFTFEDQNDEGDAYQGPTPDERGKIRLNGGILQNYRGYVHRSNHLGTGYLKDYHWDSRMVNWDFGFSFGTPSSPSVQPTELNFGEVTVGDTAFADIQVEDLAGFIEVDSFSIQPPYFVDSVVEITHGQRFTIGFAPTNDVQYNRSIHFFFSSFWLGAALHGEGTPPLSADNTVLFPKNFSLCAYPNPFNPATNISFELAAPADVQLDIYDLQGRLVANLTDGMMTAGMHEVAFNGAKLSAGVYFARLETRGAGTSTHGEYTTVKLLLLR